MTPPRVGARRIAGRSDRFEALLDAYPPAVRDVARTLRGIILNVAPALEESIDEKARVVGYGVGAGYSGLVCTIILSKKGVKVGLVGSAEWPDPDGLLEGTGKRHRYVACDSNAAAERPGLRRVLEFAMARRR